MASILVADDSFVERVTIERILLTNGHYIYKAGNGSEAITILKENELDILITDIFMPEVDGVELIMKTRKINKRIGIIAISGGGRLIKDLSYLEYVKHLGADFSFRKPIDGKLLLKAIGHLTESLVSV